MSWMSPRPGQKAILGVIHLPPLPGTPFYDAGTFEHARELTVQSACALEEGGADGCLLQTVDRVYSVGEESDPARTVAMGLIAQAVSDATGKGFQVGIQLMRNALMASLAVAKLTGGSFIRASAIVGATMTVHGMVEASPLKVMAYRRTIDAQGVGIVADIATRHFAWLGGQTSLPEVARGAKLVGADALCVGDADEHSTCQMVEAVRGVVPDLPIILAGGTNHENAARLLAAADGAFVGTCLTRDGWAGRIDVERVKSYVGIVRGLPAGA